MSFFDTKTQTVAIDDDNTVTIRALTYGEEQDIRQRAMRVKAGMDGQGEATVDAVLIQRETLRKSIVSWEGPGFDGRPVTTENINALPSSVLDPVVVAINAINKPLSDAEKKG